MSAWSCPLGPKQGRATSGVCVSRSSFSFLPSSPRGDSLRHCFRAWRQAQLRAELLLWWYLMLLVLATQKGGTMSAREQLNSYIQGLEHRLRLRAILRGISILTSAALATTIILVLVINLFAFSKGSLISARTILSLILGAAACVGIVLPLLRLNRRHAAHTAEDTFAQFQQRLVTFAERDEGGREPFLELLAADTLQVARQLEPERLVPNKTLLVSLGAGLVSLGVLIWTIV